MHGISIPTFIIKITHSCRYKHTSPMDPSWVYRLGLDLLHSQKMHLREATEIYHRHRTSVSSKDSLRSKMMNWYCFDGSEIQLKPVDKIDK